MDKSWTIKEDFKKLNLVYSFIFINHIARLKNEIRNLGNNQTSN